MRRDTWRGGRNSTDLVVRLRDSACNLASGVQSTQLDVARIALNGSTNELSRLGLTLCLDDGRTLILQRLLDDELGALSFLLGDLENRQVSFVGDKTVGEVSDVDKPAWPQWLTCIPSYRMQPRPSTSKQTGRKCLQQQQLTKMSRKFH